MRQCIECRLRCTPAPANVAQKNHANTARREFATVAGQEGLQTFARSDFLLGSLRSSINSRVHSAHLKHAGICDRKDLALGACTPTLPECGGRYDRGSSQESFPVVRNACAGVYREAHGIPNCCRIRSRNRLQLMRMAAGLVPVLAATYPQDSELPYRIIRASRTLGGASARILSASIVASTPEIGEQDETASRAITNRMRFLRRRLTSCLQKRETTALTYS
jgi:hypothetical protein